MSIRVAVAGADGRMGVEICGAVRSAGDLELVGEYSRGSGTLAGVLEGSRPDVLVDVTHHDVAASHALEAIGRGIRVVMGTSGLSGSDLGQIEAACSAHGGAFLLVPNFSIGAVLMMRFAAEAARYMPDAEVIELHHERKADSPSGTAWRTAEQIGRARSGQSSAPAGAVERAAGSRGGEVEGVRVHSVRLPGFVASQEVLFGAPGQRLSIRHDSIDRTCFMDGVLMAVRGVGGLEGLHIGLDTVMSF